MIRSFSCLFIFCCLVTLIACNEKKTLFRKLSSSGTGVVFNNKIIENDSMNPLREINVYNGGGVGAGDFNNDGLTDLYFTGNMVSNQLYLNNGAMKFKDITTISGTTGEGRWSRGVAIVDINNDGKDDIYISTAITKDPAKRKNILYVNQGNNSDGIPVFKDLAAEYGLDDTTHTAMSYFFDYDNDGDLDVYMVVNQHGRDNPNKFRPLLTDGSHPSTGRLYRNDWNDTLGHAVFRNVSKEAGITIEGYGHAAIISDINRDGWKDIYVTNDFVPNNILYINNRNGTFTDSVRQYIKQTTRFAMGVDMQDINNDGLLDIVELDMNPQDNWRKKMMLETNSYQSLQNFLKFDYQQQHIRNTLQVNLGQSMRQKDSTGNYVFSQVGYQAGIAETDWSWDPLVADFDEDGLRDIIITNGYPKDVTDHDFMVFRSKSSSIAKTEDILKQVPVVKIRNYAYKNLGDATFKDHTFDWGFDATSFSNGGIYADLDNDGDLDVVINNINDEAFVYENYSREQDKNKYLNIYFSGDTLNKKGLGTWVDIYYNGQHQTAEHSPYRGYVSSHQQMIHFGLGNTDKIDSVVVIWPNAKKQVLTNVNVNQVLTLNSKDAIEQHQFIVPQLTYSSLFRNITDSLNVRYHHYEKDYPDFIVQKLMPHKFSDYSPGLAAGDINGDGLDDLVCGGNSSHPATLFFQQTNGSFIEKKLFDSIPLPTPKNDEEFYENDIESIFKDSGILLFDADGDGDLDLYISSGGYAYKNKSEAYYDRFYTNTGKGVYKQDTTAIPKIPVSKFCVRAEDYDKDGDLDLFIAGRVEPFAFPKPVSSTLLRNDSRNGRIQFTDVTKDIAAELINIGLVCDAVFSDFDNDGWIDLILAGEFMPVTFLKNDNGKFKNVSQSSGINNKIGWWNTIAPGDFDNDGDIDYIVGNLGLNSFFRASDKEPIAVTAKDFDGNGSYDAFTSLYLPTSHDDSTRKEYPATTRDELNKQMISMRKKFTNYKQFAGATMGDLFTAEEMKGAIRLQANILASVYLRNDGNGKFSMSLLPQEAQAGSLQAMVVNDFDNDGNLDVIANGNDFGTDLSYGRMDALNGLIMKGDGKGNFKPLSILESGIYIPGNGKALVELRNTGGSTLIASTENNGPMRIFGIRKSNSTINVNANDVSAILTYANGVKQKKELYYGYSFLSQSARFINVQNQVVSVEITSSDGKKRNITVN